MHLRSLALTLGLALSSFGMGAWPVVAEIAPQGGLLSSVSPADRIVRLSTTMQMGDVMEVMRQEGLDYGKTLETDLFPGRGGERWLAIVADIYDPVQMRARFDAALTQELSGADTDLSAIEAFFGSDQGQRILRLEIEARRALLDQSIEDAAKVRWENLQSKGTARVDQLRRFAEVNDLIESNVMGALNANLGFYRGLATSGSFAKEMTEADMLRDVWSQEATIRGETEDWLFPFLSLAYDPLPDTDMDAYTAFSETPPGQRINTALFVAFDSVFTKISFDLGVAAATQMQGDDI
ncbi:MAG: DUF2059 domain-containing protein [Rhodobacteraceae bacterium]|nr:DUF2059 domain-containing protein [Paracoccaceae bacterium]MCF8516773.1 DUF2059 domain-containing protein [Paracoccaceae bacterium]MCF8521055.1 DUF2059 domain-containing protein [Paracoccaceae bacterium]